MPAINIAKQFTIITAANEAFKGSKPMPNNLAEVLDDTLKRTAKDKPTRPNRD